MKKNNMIKDKIISQIETEKIKPKSRFSFLLKEWFVWAVATLSFIFGSISISIIIFAAVNHVQAPAGIVQIIPYIWIVVMVLFIVLLYCNIKHSKRGYRFTFWIIGLLSLSATLLGGIFLYVTSTGSFVDNILETKVDSYVGVENRLKDFWQNPEEGYISGLITKINFNDEIFEIEDPYGGRWDIGYANISQNQKDILRRVDHVRVIGYGSKKGKIEACQIFPWFIRGGGSDRDAFSKMLESNGVEGFGKDIIVQEIPNERIQQIIRSNKCTSQ